MILHRLTHHGTHAFAKDVSIDFDALPSLLALHGPNGAGKTTLLDVIMAALCGEMPFRPGALSKQFTSEGVIDLTWSLNGSPYRSLIKISGDKTEGLLHCNDVVIAGPLWRDYKKAIAQIVGPTDFLLAAMYACQSGVGAFLRLARPERKALLSDMLGLQKYLRYEERSKAKASSTERELNLLRIKLVSLREDAEKRPGLEQQLESLTATRDQAQTRLDAASRGVEAATAAFSSAKEAVAALIPLKATAENLAKEIAGLAARIEDAEKRKAKNEDVLSRAAEIYAVEARAAELRVQIDIADTQIAIARNTHLVAITALQDAARERTRVQGVLNAAQLREQSLARQTGILTTVPCAGEGPYAGCQFLKDARAAKETLPGVAAEVTAAREALTPEPFMQPPTDPVPACEAAKKRLQEQLETLAPVLALGTPLAAAQSRLEELDGILNQARVDRNSKARLYADFSDRLATLPSLEDAVKAAQATVLAAMVQRTQAQQDVTEAARNLGTVEAQLDAALAAETEAAELEQRLAPLSTDLAEWTLLAKAFGQSGIPALLIDTALPELGSLATELLKECFGEQVFTIQLKTQRENASGDRLLETLDVIVSRGGEPIDALLLSGGESVLVSEALSLAIAIFNATRSGRRIQTLMRDEVGAALDISRAPAYVTMLRRAAQIGGFRHVLYVSHNERAIELADAQIEVRDGTVSVT